MTEEQKKTFDKYFPGFTDLTTAQQDDIFKATRGAWTEMVDRIGGEFTQAEADMFCRGWISCTFATIEFCRAEQEGG